MWLQQVIALVGRGKFKKAATAISKVAGPDVAEPLCQAGVRAARGKSFKEAAFFFDQAISRDPQHLAARANLGAVYQELGKLDRAADAYRQVLALKPDLAMIHSNLAGVYRAQGNLDEAVRHCREAVRLDPAMVQAHINLGVILKGQGFLDEAEVCQKQALTLAPHSSEVHCNLASLALERNQFAQAIQYCQDALRYNPDNYSAMANLAGALFFSGQKQESLAYFEAASKGSGGFDGKGQINYGLALRESGDAGRAEVLKRLTEDHIYDNPSESMDIFSELAKRLPIPPSQSREPLDWFAVNFDPGELYPAAWWQTALARFGDTRLAPDKILRAVYTNVFGWSIPTRETLSAIAGFAEGRRVSSYGAGGGYWEYLLARHFNVSVCATDLYLGHRFMPMTSVDFAGADVYPDDVVFLSWVLNEEMIVDQVLQLFDRMAPGQPLVLVGDVRDKTGHARCCGTDALFEYLDANFQLVEQLELSRFAFIDDAVGLFHRR